MVLFSSLLKSVFLLATLLSGSVGYAQQATFTVSATFYAASQPMAATQLCPEGRVQSLLATSAMRIDCPTRMNVKTIPRQNAEAEKPATLFKPYEVVVTF